MDLGSPMTDSDCVPLSLSFATPIAIVPEVNRKSCGRPLRCRFTRVPPGMPHLLAFGLGLGFAAQAGMCTALADCVLGDFLLAVVISMAGGTCLLVVLSALEMARAAWWRTFEAPEVPRRWWELTGGVLGAVALATRILSTNKIGFTLASITAVAGQLMASATIDHFALIGMTQQVMTWRRAGGITCIVLGCILSPLGPSPLHQNGSTESALILLVYSLMSLGGAAGLPIQAGVNKELTSRLHSPILVGTVSLATSLVTLVLFCAVRPWIDPTAASLTDLGRMARLPLAWWWMTLPGVVGAMYVVLTPRLSARLGMAKFFVLLTAGQFSAALLFDSLGAFFQPIRPVTVFRIVGLLLVFIGALVVQFLRSKVANPHGSPIEPTTTVDATVDNDDQFSREPSQLT